MDKFKCRPISWDDVFDCALYAGAESDLTEAARVFAKMESENG